MSCHCRLTKNQFENVTRSNIAREQTTGISSVFIGPTAQPAVTDPAAVLRAVCNTISGPSNNTSHSHFIADPVLPPPPPLHPHHPISATTTTTQSSLLPVRPQAIPIAHNIRPINEFESNDRFFLGGFPELFFLGRGLLNHNSGYLPASEISSTLASASRSSICSQL